MLLHKLYDTFFYAGLQKFRLVFLKLFVNFIYGAEFRDKCSRCFLSYPRNAGNVIRRVAIKPFIVRQKLRTESESLFYFFLIVKNRIADTFFKRVYLHFFIVNEL